MRFFGPVDRDGKIRLTWQGKMPTVDKPHKEGVNEFTQTQPP